MFEEISFLIIFLILFSLSFIYLQYIKLYHISTIRSQCQLTREKLNKIHLSTDVLDQEYYQLKQLLSSSSSINDNNIGQRLVNIENEQQRSLIDQQRIYTLEHLNRQLKNELNTAKLVNESLRKRLNCTTSMNNKNEYIIPKIRHNRSYSPSRQPCPFPYFSPWIRSRLPSIVEDKPLEIQRNFYFDDVSSF